LNPLRWQWPGLPHAIAQLGACAHLQHAGGMTKTQPFARTAERLRDDGARHGRSGRDGHGPRSRHGVVQFAHREDARQQIDVGRSDGGAARGGIRGGRRHERNLGSALAFGAGVRHTFGQAHRDRAVCPNRFAACEQIGLDIDGARQLDAGQAERRSVHEYRGIAGIDQGDVDIAHAGNRQSIHGIASGQHRAAALRIVRTGIEKSQCDLGGRKRHAVEHEVAHLLHGAVAHRHLGDDFLADVGLPDAHRGHAVVRRVDESAMDGKRAHCGRQIAAVPRPVDQRRGDRDLSEPVIDVAIRTRAFTHDDDLAGAGRGPAHAVDVLLIRIGAADQAQQRGIPARRIGGQIFGQKEHAFAGAPAHVIGGDSGLRWWVGHGGVDAGRGADAWGGAPRIGRRSGIRWLGVRNGRGRTCDPGRRRWQPRARHRRLFGSRPCALRCARQQGDWRRARAIAARRRGRRPAT